ncbi:hypothetical protein WJX74_009780 [Apatococcus lobatus]|uniref:BTB domain-containing protein n=1 Tax=Apatococcus lobatus TaxID=904363 RepID=A0AAW1RJP4_9CHLO
MAGHAYFESAPPGFADSADVILEVEDERLPAHSQFLASQSRFMTNILKDLGNSVSRSEQIVVPAAMLTAFKVQDIQSFLCQVYNFNSLPPQSAEEAQQLFRLADLFDSPKLMERCVDYLAAQPEGMFKPTTEETGVLKWAIVSERYALHDLEDQAISYIAQQFKLLHQDARLSQLSARSLLRLAQELQTVIDDRSKPSMASNHRPGGYHDYIVVALLFLLVYTTTLVSMTVLLTQNTLMKRSS